MSAGAIVGVVFGAIGSLVLLLCGGALTVGLLGVAGFQSPGGERTITYEVTGTSTASITYMDELGEPEDSPDATLPWVMAVYDDAMPFLRARIDSGTGTIACRIHMYGRVVAQETATGPYAQVSCNAS